LYRSYLPHPHPTINGNHSMVEMTGIIGQAFVYGDPAAKSTLDNAKDIADIISSIATSLALLIGGIWAYFKFIRGRTYRPRVEMQLAGEWWATEGKCLLSARVTIKNVGSSKLKLRQKGSGLRVRMLDPDQPAPPASARWREGKVYTIFDQHAWIESGETVSDVVLLDLGVSETRPVLLEGRIVWPRLIGRNIVSGAREVVPADTAINTTEDGERINHNGRRRPRWQGRQGRERRGRR
jgi:hypothetical protein